jgi:hypothetical protein
MSEVPLSVVSAAGQASRRAGPKCCRGCMSSRAALWLAVGRTLDSLSGLSEREVNITVHERASGVLARSASPIMSKPCLLKMTMCTLQDGRASAVAGSGKSLALAALPQIRRCEWLCLRGQVTLKWLAQAGVVVAWCRGALACTEIQLPSSVGNERRARGTFGRLW